MILRPDATYFAWISDDLIIGEGLWNGNLVAFDRAVTALYGNIVVACIDKSNLCCKVYRDAHDSDDGRIRLKAAPCILLFMSIPRWSYGSKARVMLYGLVLSNQLTGRLFSSDTMKKFYWVMLAIDRLSRKYGKDRVRFGVAQPNGRWKTTA